MTQQPAVRSRHKRDRKRSPGRKTLVSLLALVRTLTAKAAGIVKTNSERQILSNLSDHQLRDIGLTRDRLKSELGSGFFDITTGRICEIGFRQGGLGDPNRPRITRIPKE